MLGVEYWMLSREFKSRNSAVKKFYFGLGYLGEVQTVNEVGGLVQRRINHLTATAHDAKTQDRTLPEVLSAALCNGNIELVRYPCLYSF